jgi:hypothetical protein
VLELETEMRSIRVLLCVLIFFIALLAGCSPPAIPYPDSSLPGEVPEVFAEDILPIGERMHAAVAFGSRGLEMFWHEIPPRMMFIRYIDGTWSEPQTPEFVQEFRCLQPFFQPRSNRLYFASSMPGGEGGMDIWFVDRFGGAWGAPENIGASINTENNEMQPSLTAEGAMYYVARIEGKMFERGIFRSRLAAGQYLLRVRLPEPVNTPLFIDYTPCIAPDESYLLFSSNRQNPDKEFCQIYITFLREDGSWSTPVNVCRRLGFDLDARFPALSPDGRYLFFSGPEHMHWVSSSIIENIRAETFQ